ncbi:hypothetical protein CPB86DRAFT_118697 [Serendipita vermifera]|nr:hypothetical protein CPB86DRAFT_118697 [Serendipita vermifera]
MGLRKLPIGKNTQLFLVSARQIISKQSISGRLRPRFRRCFKPQRAVLIYRVMRFDYQDIFVHFLFQRRTCEPKA